MDKYKFTSVVAQDLLDSFLSFFPELKEQSVDCRAGELAGVLPGVAARSGLLTRAPGHAQTWRVWQGRGSSSRSGLLLCVQAPESVLMVSGTEGDQPWGHLGPPPGKMQSGPEGLVGGFYPEPNPPVEILASYPGRGQVSLSHSFSHSGLPEAPEGDTSAGYRPP